MTYLLVLFVLVGLINIYFRLAVRYNIVDFPNERTSHKGQVIRGGGVVLLVAVILYGVLSGFKESWFLGGAIFIGMTALADDILDLPPLPRVGLYGLATVLMFLEFQIDWQLWWILAAIVMVVGTLNAFNFMDGINGITTSYTLAILFSILLVSNLHELRWNEDLIFFTICALLVFGFYNFRKKAICFAGDVGSIVAGYVISYLLLKLMIATGSPVYILFVSVYGVDSVLTILHRLIKRENIFKAHRSHLYQYLANHGDISQLKISAAYGFIQLLINLLVILFSWNNLLPPILLITIVLALLGITYIAMKYRLEMRLKSLRQTK